MDKKRSILKTLNAVVFVLLLIAAFMKLASTSGKTISMFTSMGFIVALISTVAVAYGLWTVKKSVSSIGTFFSLIAFLFAAYEIIELKLDFSSFEAGFYFYVLAFIIFIVYLLTSFSKDNDDPYSIKKKDNKQFKDITGNYIICNYFDGIEYDPKANNDLEIKNKTSAIVYDPEEAELILYIGTHMMPKKVITLKNLMNIMITKKAMNNEIEKILSHDSTAKNSLIRNVETSTNISHSIDDFNALETTEAYEVEVLYFDNKITRRYFVMTKENPINFFKKITEKVTIKRDVV